MFTVFLAGAPEDGEVARRMRLSEGHRITVALDGPDVVATYKSFDSTLTLPGGRALPVNAVTGITVLPTHRRRRLLTRMMSADMARALDEGVVASILIASEGAIYPRFGYGVAALGTTWTLNAERAAFTTARSGSVRVLAPAEWAKVAAGVYDAARHRNPGTIDRVPARWDQLAQVDPTVPGYDRHRVLVVHRDEDGVADGAMAYSVAFGFDDRVPASTLTIEDLVTSTDAAYAELWRFAAEVDFVSTVVAENRSPAEPLPWLLADGRAARNGPTSDFLWVRVHDVPAALAARRYAVPGTSVLDVTDPHGHAAGRYRLDVGDDGRAGCERTSAPADVTLDVGSLGSLLLSGAPGTTSVQALRRSSRLEASDVAAARAAALFSWGDPAWCGTWF